MTRRQGSREWTINPLECSTCQLTAGSASHGHAASKPIKNNAVRNEKHVSGAQARELPKPTVMHDQSILACDEQKPQRARTATRSHLIHWPLARLPCHGAEHARGGIHRACRRPGRNQRSVCQFGRAWHKRTTAQTRRSLTQPCSFPTHRPPMRTCRPVTQRRCGDGPFASLSGHSSETHPRETNDTVQIEFLICGRQ